MTSAYQSPVFALIVGTVGGIVIGIALFQWWLRRREADEEWDDEADIDPSQDVRTWWFRGHSASSVMPLAAADPMASGVADGEPESKREAPIPEREAPPIETEFMTSHLTAAENEYGLQFKELSKERRSGSGLPWHTRLKQVHDEQVRDTSKTTALDEQKWGLLSEHGKPQGNVATPDANDSRVIRGQ